MQKEHIRDTSQGTPRGTPRDSKENICVAVRFRPLNKREKEVKDDSEISIQINTENNSVILEKKVHDEARQFSFDKIFDENSTQKNVYEGIAKDAVVSVIEGYNSTIFAYGPTSSGKTYCMFGEQEEEKRGIIPRICEALFHEVENKEKVVEATIKCSFLEIYKENIRDLLNKNHTDDESLKIRHSEAGGIYIQGLKQKVVCSPEEILETIAYGATQRSTGSTSLNSVSSRSHAVLCLGLTQKLSDETEIFSKMNLIDLAGSENVGKSEVVGSSLQEAQQINRSLSCLGNVINALTEKGRDHIPYRDSKLTYLLQDSLGGNSRTILIITASSHSSCYYETLNTLKFGKRAKDIKNIPIVNKKEGGLAKKVQDLTKIIEELEKKYEDALMSNTITLDDTKETASIKIITTLNLTIQRLQHKINYYEQELEKKREWEVMTDNFLEKQKELSTNLGNQLYKQQIICSELSSEIENYKLFFKILKNAKSASVVSMLFKNFSFEKNQTSKTT